MPKKKSRAGSPAGTGTPGGGAIERIESADSPAFRGVASHETADLHRLLVESVQDYAIFTLDPAGHVLSWNAGARRIKGYEASEIIGRHFSVFYPRELVAEGFPAFELRTAASTGRFEDEGWRIRSDGSRFWANVVITALRSPSGKLLGFGKVTRDLTERREAEERLRESEERFRLLVDGVKDYAIFMLDPLGKVATWNAGAERINRYEASEIIGQHFSRFYPAADVAAGKPEHELETATRAGRYEEEGWRLRKDGSSFWASVLITALRNAAGELVGFAKVTRDLTERRAAEERAMESARRVAAEEAVRRQAEARAHELRHLAEQLQLRTSELEDRTREAEEARRRADQANTAKSQFLAAMSHELRTPLNAIGGYTDLLAMGISGPVNEQQRGQLERIRRSQDHLLKVINDILNFSRIEAGQMRYDLEPAEVVEVVNAVVQMVAPQADRKSLRIDTGGCEPDVTFYADKSKVEQILLNLLSNAVKFTSAGTIAISSRAVGDRVMIAVRDSGHGIPAEHLESVFEPFVQVGQSLTENREGSGLGLAISRDLARAMGGDVTVKSTVDVGSEFTLTLPRHQP